MIDEDDVERLNDFRRLAYGPVRLGNLPDGWKELSEHPEIPTKGTFFVEYLPGGILLGRGWYDRTQFEHDVLARQYAYEKANDGTPARILYQKGSKLYVHCVFYKKNDRVCISLRANDSTIVEQEMDGPYDITGGPLEVLRQEDSEVKDALKGLGYKV